MMIVRTKGQDSFIVYCKSEVENKKNVSRSN